MFDRLQQANKKLPEVGTVYDVPRDTDVQLLYCSTNAYT